MAEEETTIDEEYCKTHNEDKSMYEKPLGKLFLTLITIYSFLIAILALTYNKDLFIFLPATTILIGISCFILLYAVIKANIIFYDEKLPKLVKIDLEKSSLGVLVIIIGYFSISFLDRIYFSIDSIPRIWLTLLFCLSQTILGAVIILFQLSTTIQRISAKYYMDKDIQAIITRVRNWVNKNRKIFISVIFVFHVSCTTSYFYFHVETDALITFLDWFFFGELIVMFLLPEISVILIDIYNKVRLKVKEMKR